MLHLQPTSPPSGYRDENLYEDWLQTLTQRQFEDHIAGRYAGPYIGRPKKSRWARIINCAIIALAAAIVWYSCVA